MHSNIIYTNTHKHKHSHSRDPRALATVALHDASVPEPSVGARRHKRVPASFAMKPVGSRRYEADACGAERVAKAEASPVNVKLVHGHPSELGGNEPKLRKGGVRQANMETRGYFKELADEQACYQGRVGKNVAFEITRV